MALGLVTASIAAENTFSDAMEIKGNFNFSLSGTWSATVFIQRSYDKGANWLDVKSYTANIEDVGFESEFGVLYRAGVKTDGFTSGTVIGRLSF